MATYEYNGLMTVKDAAGNKYLLYPITKAECVDGLEEALAAKAAATHHHAAGDVNSGIFDSCFPPSFVRPLEQQHQRRKGRQQPYPCRWGYYEWHTLHS